MCLATLSSPLIFSVDTLLQPHSKSAQGHHNLPLTVLGGALIWGGWYSFNGGSAFAANGQAGLALMNTHCSAIAAASVWVFASFCKDRHWHLTEILNGAFAGLAAITPGSGYCFPPSAFVVGIIAGTLSWIWVSYIGPRLKYDDALDVVALQGIPGIVGTIAVGITGELFEAEGRGMLAGGSAKQLGIQTLGALVTVAWSSLWTALLMFIMKRSVGINVTADIEERGLDYVQIGEQAYDDALAVGLDLGDGVLTAKLCEAASQGHVADLQRILRSEVNLDVNGGDYDGRTPLHLAAAGGHLPAVQFLVKVCLSVRRVRRRVFVQLQLLLFLLILV